MILIYQVKEKHILDIQKGVLKTEQIFFLNKESL